MKFSVITPCLNPGDRLPETVSTVLNQTALESGRASLEYVIVDGGSTDGTVEYLNSIGDDPRVHWWSEPDDGLYDALVKGLRIITGEVHSYLNAGDMYHSHAFDVVTDVLSSTDGWVKGMDVIYNQRGDVVYASTPAPFKRGWIQRGLYDGRHLDFVQQESVFWISHLTQSLDLDYLAQLRYAGDAYIWSTFARVADLTVIGAHLGGRVTLDVESTPTSSCDR